MYKIDINQLFLYYLELGCLELFIYRYKDANGDFYKDDKQEQVISEIQTIKMAWLMEVSCVLFLPYF